MTSFSLTNHLLISMPMMQDPYFNQTVSLICQHDENGAMGIILNRILDCKISDIYDHLNIEPTHPRYINGPVYHGGPVHSEFGFVLHQATATWQSTMPIGSELALTSSADIIQAMANGEAPKKFNFTLGFAGWNPGQLESEIQQNAWLSVAADQVIIFETPIEQRWHKSAELIGVDMNRISAVTGHG